MLHVLIVPPSGAGSRLDVWLEQALTGCSRSLVARLIKEGLCLVEPGKAKAGYFLRGGEKISLEVPDIEPVEAAAEDIPISILHEDEHLIVLDKAAGMVVHPAVGNMRGTLVNALLGRYGKALSGGEAWRPGIVHRLDQETSGVICVARTPQALAFLQGAFKERQVQKRYLALIHGAPKADFLEHGGWIGRHPKDFRKRCVMPANAAGAKEAYTSIVIRARHQGYAVAEARPRTGRTHQIRVHLADLGHPVLADRVYGRSRVWPVNAAENDPTALRRHALHAWAIDIPHPAGGRQRIEAPIPEDLRRLVREDLHPGGW